MKENIRGASKTGCLIWLVLLGTALLVGYKFGQAQWAYLSMKEELHEVAKLAAVQRSIDQGLFQKEIIKRGENLGIDIDPEDISITEDENTISIFVRWYAELEFPGYVYYKEYELTASYKKGM